MITCELKDKILKKIVDQSKDMVYTFHLNESPSIFGESRNVVSAILDDFENKGLIYNDRNLGGFIRISVLVPAHDLIRHGGFTAQEELLEKNIQKLLLEVESLKPSMPDKVEKITSIISGISSGLALFIK